MIKDNIHFTTIESGFDQIELVGTYEVSTSLLIREAMWRSGGKEIMNEAKELITDQLRKFIVADMLDVPFLKLLYKSDAVKNVVIDALDRRAHDMRMNMEPGILDKPKYEELKILELIIYDLRTLNEKEL